MKEELKKDVIIQNVINFDNNDSLTIQQIHFSLSKKLKIKKFSEDN